MTVDIDRIKSEYRVSEVVGRYVNLTKQGTEYVGLCPFHADRDPSLHVIDAKKFWNCMACGESGDVLDFVEKHLSVSMPAAAEIITGRRASPEPTRHTPPPAEPDAVDEITWRAIMPVPADAPPLVVNGRARYRQHRKPDAAFADRAPAAVYEYRDSTGELLGAVVRIEWTADGKRHKITPTVTYCESSDGERAWVDRSFPEPRPLYGLDQLAARPGKMVFCVEGEKSADAARRIFPDNPVITWPNGTNSVSKAEWSALKGHNVVFWPDADSQRWPESHPNAGELKPLADQPGTKAMTEAAALLRGIAATLIIEPPADAENGWDAADAEIEWGPEKTRAWMKSALDAAKRASIVAPPAEPTPAAEPDPTPEYEGPPDPPPGALDADPYAAPFRLLGHDRGVFYYLPRGSRQVVELTAPAHTKLNLFQLASPGWWDSAYPTKKGCDWDTAAAALMAQSFKVGVFNRSRKRRGRGAWVDHGRNVYHLGDRLWVDGEIVEIDKFQTRFVYEQADAMEIDLSHPLTNTAAHEALDIAREFSWASDLHAYLLAGWCVIAPVCGVLDWRPHFWMTGPSGSGKSTIMRDFVRVMLSSSAFVVEGGTTEAFIRQSLDGDARPVVFDEAEGKDELARARLRAVLDLARVASSESGGEIGKGGSNHVGRVFRVRSCFGFGSINPSIEFYADETRITRLSLTNPGKGADEEQKEKRAAAWEELAARIASTITPEFAEGMIARTVRNLVTMQENSRIFAAAASTMFGSARHGQQYGPMLAGAYLLHTTGRVDYTAALAWLRKHDFSSIVATADEDSDDARCIAHILQARVRATLRQGRNEDYSVAELLSEYYGSADDPDMGDRALSYLLRIGLKPENGGLWVANKHSELSRIMQGTPWASGWRETLAGATGAVASKKAIYFKEYVTSKAVLLPPSALK